MKFLKSGSFTLFVDLFCRDYGFFEQSTSILVASHIEANTIFVQSILRRSRFFEHAAHAPKGADPHAAKLSQPPGRSRSLSAAKDSPEGPYGSSQQPAPIFVHHYCNDASLDWALPADQPPAAPRWAPTRRRRTTTRQCKTPQRAA